MPFSSADRDNNDSFLYSAIENEPTRGDDRSGRATSIVHDDVGADGLTVDYETTSESRCLSPNNKSEDPDAQKASFLIGEQNTSAYTGPKIHGWPAAPRKLKGFSVPLFVADVLLILLPCAFILLGISASQLDGKGLSRAGATVERAMNLGPTIYPLAFAAIGGRCLRNVAIFLAERGTTIATLEKLLGSQSLVSAVGTALTLRSFTLLSVGVVFLWTLSPLGGQSSLRLLHRANFTAVETGPVYYSDHNAPFDPEETTSRMQVVPPILAASLASSLETKALSIDLWNHPKIPRLEDIEQLALTGSTTEGEWIKINATAEQKYSSWTGVNIQNLRKSSSAEFEVKHNYMHLNCQVLYRGGAHEVWEHMLAANLTTYNLLPTTISEDIDDLDSSALNAMMDLGYIPSLSMFVRVASSSDVHSKLDIETSSGFGAHNQDIRFLYGSNYLNRTKTGAIFQVHTCTPHVVTLDAQISCEAGNCAATQLRYVPGPSRSTLATSCINIYTVGCLNFGTNALFPFLRWLPQALQQSLGGGRNAFDDWIGGENVTYSNFKMDLDNDVRIADLIPDERISERLTVVMNTFYQAVTWGPQITRAGLFERPDLSESNANPIPPERWVNTTEATFSRISPVYKADPGWIAALLGITTLLLLLSIINIVISYMTIAPDLFYYASSLARENPYTDTPDGGTAMDGGQRSRLLRAMKVQIADVSPNNNIGYVVLKSIAEGDDFESGRLRKDRLYW